MDDDIQLPPLPHRIAAHSFETVMNYARAAVLADRERRALWEAQPAMTDTIMQPNQVPLVEQLRSVPSNARLTINTPNPLGSDTQHFAIGAMCHKAAARLAALEMELEAANRDAEDCDLFLVCVEEAINELRAVLRRTPARKERT